MLWVAVCYWGLVVPRVRRELVRWEKRAKAIPNPKLKQQAQFKLKAKTLSTEGGAVFAVARPILRDEVVKFVVAYETIVDYLDTLSEDNAGDLRDSRQLNRALVDSVELDAPSSDYYAHHPESNDGGYLAALVTECRRSLASLSSYEVVRPGVSRFAELLCEVQSIKHATDDERASLLERWAAEHTWSQQDIFWWELAAAANTPLAIFSLLSLAGNPRTSSEDAGELEAAYFPWISALNTLLDHLVDLPEDEATGQLNYVGQYQSPKEKVERLQLIADRALGAARSLPDSNLHVVAVSGIIAMYLSGPEINSQGLGGPAQRLLAGADPIGRLIFLVFKAKRWVGHLSTATG